MILVVMCVFVLFKRERRPCFPWEGGGLLSFSSGCPGVRVEVQLLYCDGEGGEGVRGEL